MLKVKPFQPISEVQATTVGVSVALISNVVHLELTTCAGLVPSGPIWSIRITTEESSLRPGLGIPRNARDILASPEPLRWLPAAHLPVTFKHGSKWFQYVPMCSRKLPANQTWRISHLHQYRQYRFIYSTAFMDFPWPSLMEVWSG